MQVFSAGGGAGWDTIMAGLEDCVRLDVDACNLSLGAAGGFTTGDMSKTLELFESTDIEVLIAAGIEYVIKQKGLTPGKDLTLDDSIKFDLMASAFTSGSADYVTLFEPTASNIEKLGKGHIVASVGKEAGEIPYTAYFAKKSYIENNQTTIQNFTNAIYKGQKWVKEHTAKEIAEAIQSFFPDTDIDLLTTAIQSYKDIDAWNETPVLKQESFDKLQEVMSLAGELKVKAPYGKIVNNKYAEEAIK